MKEGFRFTLEGRDWSRLYNWYWGPMLALMILSMVTSRQSEAQPTSPTPLLLSLVISFLTMLLQSYFAVPIYRTWLSKLTLDGKAYAFGGDVRTYLLLNVKGFLLSMVTLGVYLPWYAQKVLDYLASETTYEGQNAQFVGRPHRLFWPLFAAVLLFAIVVGVLAIQMVGVRAGAVTPATLVPVSLLTLTLALAFTGPVIYFVYQWMLQFRWNGRELRLGGGLVSGALQVVGHLALTVITFGLWWPAATVHLYRLFVQRVELTAGGALELRFVFEGRAGEAYGFLWGQLLLTLVTLGFYGAWSGPNISRWFAARTFAIRAS